MTLWQYSIARHFAQLLAESDTRVLTERETILLDELAPNVERYEALELAANLPGGAQSVKRGGRRS